VDENILEELVTLEPKVFEEEFKEWDFNNQLSVEPLKNIAGKLDNLDLN